MAIVLVEKSKPIHHPRVQAAARVPSDFADDVGSIFEPGKLGAGRCREDRDFAIFALVSVLRYVFAIVSETRFSVV